jgi:hypothetical protein
MLAGRVANIDGESKEDARSRQGSRGAEGLENFMQI